MAANAAAVNMNTTMDINITITMMAAAADIITSMAEKLIRESLPSRLSAAVFCLL